MKLLKIVNSQARRWGASFFQDGFMGSVDWQKSGSLMTRWWPSHSRERAGFSISSVHFAWKYFMRAGLLFGENFCVEKFKIRQREWLINGRGIYPRAPVITVNKLNSERFWINYLLKISDFNKFESRIYARIRMWIFHESSW